MSNIYGGNSLVVTTNCKPWSRYKSYYCHTQWKEPFDLGTWIADLLYSLENGILNFHVATGKGDEY